MKIRCFTLFDITRTNVNSRRKNLDSDRDHLVLAKSGQQQSNFETVLQIISMRAQPEDITDPEKVMESLAKNLKWGSSYANKTKIPVWRFEFTVSQPSVFNNGVTELGNLHADCSGVPMNTKLDEWTQIKNILDVSQKYRNIYFETSDEA